MNSVKENSLHPCGKCGYVLRINNGYEHDRMCHSGYFLLQHGIDECVHEHKTRKVVLDLGGLTPFHMVMCNLCADKIQNN